MANAAALPPQQVQAISNWLIEAALATTALTDLIDGYATRLNAASMALARMTLGTHLLHPTWEAQAVRWTRDGPLETEAFAVGSTSRQPWQQSPIRAAVEAPNTIIRRRLDGSDAARDFPVLAELKAAGYPRLARRPLPQGGRGAAGHRHYLVRGARLRGLRGQADPD